MTLRRIWVLSFFCGFLFVKAFPQSVVEADSVVFQKYCMDDIVPTPPLHLLQGIAKYWTDYDEYYKYWASTSNTWFPSTDYYTAGHEDSLPFGYGRQPLHEYIKQLKIVFEYKEREESVVASEKEKLIQSLEAMDTLLHNKPLFFVTINSKPYNGNIRKYVDDMYKKSFMCSERNFKKMMRSTRPKRLLKDLGVNYAIGVALYKLWLKQQAEAADSTATR